MCLQLVLTQLNLKTELHAICSIAAICRLTRITEMEPGGHEVFQRLNDITGFYILVAIAKHPL